MNCPKCGLLIAQGNMSTTLPLCQCHWQVPNTGMNSLDKMEDYDRLAKLCEKLRELDKKGYQPLTGAIGETAATEIEALFLKNLRSKAK
jgi:hypothetical protein